MTTAADFRTELIQDLRAFADLLERRPDIPINSSPWMKLQYSAMTGTEAERLAEIRQIAAVLGVDAEEDERGITATLDLGCIEYKAYASTDYGRAAWEADWSYRGAIEPNMAGAR